MQYLQELSYKNVMAFYVFTICRTNQSRNAVLFSSFFHGFQTAVVFGGIEHSNPFQQSHSLRVAISILLLLLRHSIESESSEEADAHFNCHIRSNPQFSVIQRKQHVVRTERDNRKRKKKEKKKWRSEKVKIHLTEEVDLHQLPYQISCSSFAFLYNTLHHARSTCYLFLEVTAILFI